MASRIHKRVYKRKRIRKVRDDSGDGRKRKKGMGRLSRHHARVPARNARKKKRRLKSARPKKKVVKRAQYKQKARGKKKQARRKAVRKSPRRKAVRKTQARRKIRRRPARVIAPVRRKPVKIYRGFPRLKDFHSAFRRFTVPVGKRRYRTFAMAIVVYTYHRVERGMRPLERLIPIALGMRNRKGIQNLSAIEIENYLSPPAVGTAHIKRITGFVQVQPTRKRMGRKLEKVRIRRARKIRVRKNDKPSRKKRARKR